MPTPLHTPHGGAMLTAAQAAELLGTNTNTLSSWRYKGEGPTYVRLGDGERNVVRYPKADLLAWIEAHTVRPGEAVAQ